MRLLGLCIAAAVLLACPGAFADVAPLPGGPQLQDCDKARDPTRCKARIEARQDCRDKRGNAKRACMSAYMMSPDCAHAEQPKRCIARKEAEKACHGKQGKQLKACLQAHRSAAKPTPKGNAGATH